MFMLHLMGAAILASSGAVIVALGLSSIVFFSTVLIVVALLMRNRWNDMGPRNDRERLR